MEIIDYSSKYDNDIKDLLVELQEHIVKIDKEKYNILTDDYREKYFEKTMSEVDKFEGKIFLAIEGEKAIGLIVGLINNEEDHNFLRRVHGPQRRPGKKQAKGHNHSASGNGQRNGSVDGLFYVLLMIRTVKLGNNHRRPRRKPHKKSHQ